MEDLKCPVLIDGLQCGRELVSKGGISRVGPSENRIIYQCESGHWSHFIFPTIRMLRATYCRLTNSFFWHFCNNCTRWPIEDYVQEEHPAHPPAGGFCVECIEKRRTGNCSGWNVGLD